MVQRADDIRHDIENTRAAMTGKFAILEACILETVTDAQASVEKIMEEVGGIVQEVRATVDTTLGAVRQGVTGTSDPVAEIVEHVKGMLGETAATVQRLVNLPAQVERHPWPMVGGVLLAGYLLARWGGSQASAAGSPQGSPGVAASARPQPQPGRVNGMLEQLQDDMQGDIANLKSAAVGVVMNTFREMVKQAIPTLAAHLEQSHTKAGGPPGYSPVPPPAMSSAAINDRPS